MEQSKNNGNKTKVTPITNQFVGKTLGNFRIVEELGRGGMGLVYKTYDRALDRVVALKILPPQLQDEEFIKRFVREARTSAKLDHPNVVQIYSVGKSQETWYIAMQYINGKTIAEYLNEGFGFSIRQALIITRAVLSALGTAHRLGIIHRDIKPSNIMIDEQGKVKVMDFGLARAMLARSKMTQTGTYLGTPEYSSPEQCESGQVDGRADLYSLGVVLYELLSGRVPHVAETPLVLFKKIVSEPPIPLREINHLIPVSIERLVAKMMAKKKEARYQNAKEIIKDIDNLLQTERLPHEVIAKPVRVTLDEKVTPVRPRLISTLRKPAQSLLALGVVGVGLILLGFILFMIHLTQRPPDTRSPQIGPAAQVISAPVAQEKVTLIVFDFINQSGKTEARWLEIALPDMLIASLAQNERLQTIPRYDLLAKMRQLGKKITLGLESDERVVLTPESNTLINSFKTDLVVRGSFYVTDERKIRIITDLYRYYAESKESLQHISTATVDGTDYNQELFRLVDQLSEKVLTTLHTKASDFGLLITDLRPSQTKGDIKNLVAQLLTDTFSETRFTQAGDEGNAIRGRHGVAGKAGDTRQKELARARLEKAKTLEDALKFGAELKQPPPAAPAPEKQDELNKLNEDKKVKQEEQDSQAVSNFQVQQYLRQEKDIKSLSQALKKQQSLGQGKSRLEKAKESQEAVQERLTEKNAEIKTKPKSVDTPGAVTEINEPTLAQEKSLTQTIKTNIILPDGEEIELDEMTMNQLLQQIYQTIQSVEEKEFKVTKEK